LYSTPPDVSTAADSVRGNQKPSSGENLMEFDRDFDFFRQFEVWVTIIMGSRGKLKNVDDVLKLIDASDWVKDDSFGEFSSDGELDSDIDDPNAITQYRVSTYRSPGSRIAPGGSSYGC
jgi:hypothetical protein